MGWTLTPLGRGYGRIDGAVYALYIVVTDEVSQAEHDEFLELFSRRRARDNQAARWLGEWLKEKQMKQQDVTNTESYDEMFQKLMEALPIEKRLAGLAPEERLLGLDRDQQALALPIEVLRGLTESTSSLAPQTQEEVRRRLQRGDHWHLTSITPPRVPRRAGARPRLTAAQAASSASGPAARSASLRTSPSGTTRSPPGPS